MNSPLSNLRSWYLLQRQKARRLALSAEEEEKPPTPWDPPKFSVRGQTSKFYARVSSYEGGTPDHIQCETSPTQAVWSNTTTQAAPEVDAPVMFDGLSMSGNYWVRLRYEEGGVWSEWGTAVEVDTVSAPPTPDVSNWNADIFEAEYRVISYGSPTRDVWRIESGPSDSGPWTLWSEGAPPPEDETVAFLQPDFGGFVPTIFCRFRYHDNELDKTSPWVIPDSWNEP